MPVHLRRALALTAALLLSGCSGGSSEGNPVLPDDAASAAGGGGGFNGPLTGTLVIDRRPLDLTTGARGEELVPDDRSGSRAVSAAPDGRTFYYTEPDCRDRPRSASLSYDCVVLLDGAGGEIGRLDPSLDLTSNAPNVSPDGRFFAVSSTEIHGSSHVVVLGADGEILDDAARATLESRVDWAPDGDMYYVVGDALYRARVGAAPASDELLRRFDGAFLRTVRISPDGTRLAIELDIGSGVTEQVSSIWLTDADGGDPHEFATATFLPTVRHPLWSPDGRWLLVAAGGAPVSTGRPTPAENLDGGLFALDASVRTHVIDDLASGDAGTRRSVVSDCGRTDGERRCDLGARFVSAWLP